MSAAGTSTLPQREDLRRQALRLEYFTIAWNVAEAIVAIVAGWLAGSIALVGFGLDSIIESISGVALLWRLRQTGDLEAEAESRALRIVGLTFFLLAAYVTYEAVGDLSREPGREAASPGRNGSDRRSGAGR